MKKFLKYKIDYSESSNETPKYGHSAQTIPNPDLGSQLKKDPKMERQSPVKEIFQPPLPSYPPPPDSPPIIPLPLKVEVVDEGYADNSQGCPNLVATKTEEISPRFSFEQNLEEPDSTSTDTPNLTICRDFIRGHCSRGGTCKYAHQRDLSQLSGVYTFCRNYQNTVCTFSQCKYVHATVFEEQEFYRTGVLPPYALNHSRKPIYMMPPPPPPPPPPQEAPEFLPNMSVTTPHHSADQPIGCVPVPKLEFSSAENNFRNLLQALVSPLKREWSGSACSTNAFGNPSCELDHTETYEKKCINCDHMELRLLINKQKCENITRSTQDLKTKMARLDSKTGVLNTILSAVLKSKAASNGGGLNGLMTAFSKCGEDVKPSSPNNPHPN